MPFLSKLRHIDSLLTDRLVEELGMQSVRLSKDEWEWRGNVYLLLSIVLSTILGFVLLTMGPLIGGVIAFGIVVGCIFRGLYLLNDLHKSILSISPKKDKVQQAYENYLKERDRDSN